MKTIYIILLCFAILCCKNPIKDINTTEPKQIKSNNFDNAYENINLDNYKFNTIDGTLETINLNQDKVYILDFWYLECAPCIKDHRNIKAKIDSLSAKNIEVIGLSIDRNTKKWRSFVKAKNYNWPNYNQYNQEKILYKNLGIHLFPSYKIINGKGYILYSTNRFKKAINFIKDSLM